jgi:enamine deaminase RidA (YjgF/YER057c/UK114 family)
MAGFRTKWVGNDQREAADQSSMLRELEAASNFLHCQSLHPKGESHENRVDRQSVVKHEEQPMSNTIKRHQSGPVHSRVVEHGSVVYIAGTTAENRAASCKEQTEEILKKLDSFLALGGTSKSRLLTAIVWLTDIRQKEQMDAAWKAWVDPDNKPARACVESRLGTPDTLVEIMVTAAK